MSLVTAETPRGLTPLAALYAVLVAGIFTLIFASGRLASGFASPLQIIFLRYAGGFLTILVIAALRRENWSPLTSPRPSRHLLRGVAGALGGAAMLYGNAEIPIVDVTAISLLSPVFVIFLGVSLLGDRLSPKLGLGVALSMLGALVIVLSRGAFSDARASYLLPVLAVTGGSFMLAVENLFIKLLSETDTPLVALGSVNLFGTVVLAIPALLTWRASGWESLLLLGLGPLAILGQYLNIRANRLAPVSLLAPLGYSSLVFAALIGWAAFAEIPSPGAIIGCGAILVGGLWLASARPSPGRA